MDILKLSTATNILVFMKSSSDHLTGKTGLTLTVSMMKDGGAFSTISPVVVEKGYGWYQLSLTASNLNTLGVLGFHITGLNADPTDIQYRVSEEQVGLTASAVWDFSSRTLTYSPDNLMSINDGELSFTRGDSLSYTFTNIDLTSYGNVYFTIKKNYQDEDAESIIQVDSTTGLLYVNGCKILLGIGAELDLDAINKTVTLTVNASVTKKFPYSSNPYVYDLQVITTDDIVTTPVNGYVYIVRDVTKKIV